MKPVCFTNRKKAKAPKVYQPKAPYLFSFEKQDQRKEDNEKHYKIKFTGNTKPGRNQILCKKVIGSHARQDGEVDGFPFLSCGVAWLSWFFRKP